MLAKMAWLLPAVVAFALLGFSGAWAAETSFYQHFTNVLARGERGFLSDASLVDTNNAGPNLTNAPISFARFHGAGELAGIKLGMSMSEVVAAWGKPPFLHSHCVIGPRFGYGERFFSGVSLFFLGDRLALIGVARNPARGLMFDNGLNGMMTKADFEKVLGAPDLPKPDWHGMFVGDVAYLTNGVRIDLGFSAVPQSQSTSQSEPLYSISVRLEAKPESRIQPVSAETNAGAARPPNAAKAKETSGRQ